MRRSTALALAVVTGAALTSCSGGDSGGSGSDSESASASASPSPSPSDDRDPAQVLQDAVGTTLSTSSFSLDGELALTIGAEQLSLTSSGSVDYATVVADVEIGVSQSSGTATVQILSDGTTLWVAAEGAQVPAFPDGATWLQGDAQRLGDSSTFTQDGLIGVVLALRGAEDVQEGEPTEADGVAARTFTTTIPYRDAVQAAGSDADALTSSLSLTGGAADSDLVVEATIGSDDVVRELDIEVDSQGGAPVSGSYTLSLSDVGADVEAPEAPDPADVATGPQAEALLDQLVTS